MDPGSALWLEWDGEGLPDAVAWAEGWHDDIDEIRRAVRRLGVEIRECAVINAWVGMEDAYDVVQIACNSEGSPLDGSELLANAGTIIRATFVTDAERPSTVTLTELL